MDTGIRMKWLNVGLAVGSVLASLWQNTDLSWAFTFGVCIVTLTNIIIEEGL